MIYITDSMKGLRIKIEIEKIIAVAFSVFFLLSLSIHSHTFAADNLQQYENSTSSKQLTNSHSLEFCSACRADGKTHISKEVYRLGLGFNTTFYKNLGQSLYSFALVQLKQSRAPPYIS